MGGGDESNFAKELVYFTLLGGAYGASKVFWDAAPSTATINKPFEFSNVLKSGGKYSLHFTIAGALYLGGRSVAESVRGHHDAFNSGVGGALLGAFVGLRGHRLHSVVASAVVGAIAGTALEVFHVALWPNKDPLDEALDREMERLRPAH